MQKLQIRFPLIFISTMSFIGLFASGFFQSDAILPEKLLGVAGTALIAVVITFVVATLAFWYKSTISRRKDPGTN